MACRPFEGRLRCFGTGKSWHHRVLDGGSSFLPMRQGVGRGEQYPRASGQELTLNKQGAQGARCAVRLRGARWSVRGHRRPALRTARAHFERAGGGTNRAAARACCHARTCSAARRPQTTYSSGMREPSAVSLRLRLLCHPASPPTPPLRASDAEGHVIFKFTQQTKRRV